MRKSFAIVFLLATAFAVVPCAAQISNPVIVPSSPPGSCGGNLPMWYNGVNLYGCASGTPAQLTGSGTGGINQLTGDVTAGPGTGSQVVTVVGFDGIPFTNTPSPSLSDVICYDGVQFTPCPPTAGPAQILYVTNTASDISGYDLWDTSPLGSQFTIPVTIPATTTKTLIEAFATASGYPNATVIPSGEWQADSYVQVSSASNTTTLNIDVYDRTSGGVETLLFSFGNTTVSGNGTAVTHYTAEAVEPAFSIGATDRLVIKYNMTKTGGASITGTLYGGGSTSYSHVHTPLGTSSSPTFSSLTVGSGSAALYRCSGGTSDGLVMVSPSTAATACTSGSGTLVNLKISTP
jgi:hypothetical protein